MAPTPTGLGGKAPGRCPEAREVLSAGEVSWSFHRTCIRNGLDEGLDKFYGFYSGLLETCQRRANQLKYSHDERRRTASPARRKSHAQSVGSGAAAVERAIGPGKCPDQRA